MRLSMLNQNVLYSAMVSTALFVASASAGAAERVREITDAEFKQRVLKSAKPVLVDFYADWCGPCKQLSPTIEALSHRYKGKVDFYKMNIDTNPRTADSYGVDAIPALKLFKDAKLVNQSVGIVSESSLIERLERVLK